MIQSSKSLSYKHKDLSLIPSLRGKLGMVVVHACNLRAEEAETGEYRGSQDS